MRKILATLLFLSLITHPLCALQLSELLTDIRKRINDSSQDTALQYWSDTELKRKINIIQDEIVAYTRAIESRHSISTTEGKREYALPDDLLVLKRVAYSIMTSSNVDSGKYKRLERTSIAELDVQLPLWETSGEGLPTKYYRRGGAIGLQPAPSSVYHSTYPVLRIDYIANPYDLSVSTDVPFNGLKYMYPYHRAIIFGVVAECLWERQLYTQAMEMDKTYWTLMQTIKANLENEIDKFIGVTVYPRE